MTRRRIAFAGFQHETNTFAPGKAGVEEFRRADSWPGLLRGAEVAEGSRGLNLPIAGALARAESRGDVDATPIAWCSAEPSGHVADEAFAWAACMILQGLRDAWPLDGLYLDLHGAMVTESLDDGEGALLAMIREKTGPDFPVGVSLDMHANVSPGIVRAADAISIYRTYPHLDMAETGERCIDALMLRIAGCSPARALRQAPFLVPLHAQHTGRDPARRLYGALDGLAAGEGESVDLAMGFTAADVADCGPSVVAYAPSDARAGELADAILDLLVAAEAEFEVELATAEEAVRFALGARGGRPVVIADVQDNPGAGGTSGTTGLLHALLDAGAENALLGVMHDPEIAAFAHAAGVGGTVEGALGARAGLPGPRPVEGSFRVEALSDGRIPYSGQMYGGGVAEIGPSCLLSAGGVRIVASSERTQCLDRAFFEHFGADPAKARIVCVKSTAHFRADFEPIADRIILAASPGAFDCALADAPYRNLREGVRLGPLGPAFERRSREKGRSW